MRHANQLLSGVHLRFSSSHLLFTTQLQTFCLVALMQSAAGPLGTSRTSGDCGAGGAKSSRSAESGPAGVLFRQVLVVGLGRRLRADEAKLDSGCRECNESWNGPGGWSSGSLGCGSRGGYNLQVVTAPLQFRRDLSRRCSGVTRFGRTSMPMCRGPQRGLKLVRSDCDCCNKQVLGHLPCQSGQVGSRGGAEDSLNAAIGCA